MSIETLAPGAEQTTDTELLLAPKVMRVLFDRQGVPERKRSKTVQEVLGISYQAAHRRMNSDGPWNLDEMERVAAHYGESLADLFQALHEKSAVSATFVAGTFRCSAKAWLGAPTVPSHPTSLIARQEGEGWLVTPAGNLDIPSISVKSLMLEPGRVTRLRVAVVDDDPETVNGACAYLTEVGFDAHPFMNFAALRDAMKDTRYDAFILDWWVGAETALETIAFIRSEDSTCSIGVLTGQIQSGRVQPSDVATVIQNYGVAVPFEKPLRAPILAAWLHQSLPSRV